jgi:hypothetical protein
MEGRGIDAIYGGAIVAVYLAFRNGTSLWLISSARGATTAVFILGMVGGCALSAGSLRVIQKCSPGYFQN